MKIFVLLIWATLSLHAIAEEKKESAPQLTYLKDSFIYNHNPGYDTYPATIWKRRVERIFIQDSHGRIEFLQSREYEVETGTLVAFSGFQDGKFVAQDLGRGSFKEPEKSQIEKLIQELDQKEPKSTPFSFVHGFYSTYPSLPQKNLSNYYFVAEYNRDGQLYRNYYRVPVGARQVQIGDSEFVIEFNQEYNGPEVSQCIWGLRGTHRKGVETLCTSNSETKPLPSSKEAFKFAQHLAQFSQSLQDKKSRLAPENAFFSKFPINGFSQGVVRSFMSDVLKPLEGFEEYTGTLEPIRRFLYEERPSFSEADLSWLIHQCTNLNNGRKDQAKLSFWIHSQLKAMPYYCKRHLLYHLKLAEFLKDPSVKLKEATEKALQIFQQLDQWRFLLPEEALLLKAELRNDTEELKSWPTTDDEELESERARLIAEGEAVVGECKIDEVHTRFFGELTKVLPILKTYTSLTGPEVFMGSYCELVKNDPAILPELDRSMIEALDYVLSPDLWLPREGMAPPSAEEKAAIIAVKEKFQKDLSEEKK
ncbi:MAG: hypothetical protein AB1540_06710 [Bdellovibrionota bacterium]